MSSPAQPSPRYRKIHAELDSSVKNNLQKYFEIFDTNKSGFIEPKELRSVLNSAGHHFSDRVVDALFKAVDGDNDGQISFEEFTRLTALMEGFRTAFERLDLEKKGKISPVVLGEWLLDLGYNITYRELKRIVHAVDTNHTSQLEFEEFIELGLFLEGLRSLFRKREQHGVVQLEELRHILKDTHLERHGERIITKFTKQELTFDEFFESRDRPTLLTLLTRTRTTRNDHLNVAIPFIQRQQTTSLNQPTTSTRR